MKFVFGGVLVGVELGWGFSRIKVELGLVVFFLKIKKVVWVVLGIREVVWC